MNIKKKLFFQIFLILIISIILFFLVYFFYLGFNKLLFSRDHGEKLGKISSYNGWILKKNKESFEEGINKITGKVYFHSKIFINRDGFRDYRSENYATENSWVILGDSYTFGVGVNHNETIGHFIEVKSKKKVNNLGIPGYSDIQSFLFLEKNINLLKPQLVIIFENGGLEQRSKCFSKELPKKNPVPCFWWDEKNNRIVEIEPDKDTLNSNLSIFYTKKHIYETNYLSLGYDKIQYYFFIRPVKALKDIWEYFFLDENNYNLLKLNYNSKIRNEKILSKFNDLAEENNFKILLVDASQNIYKNYNNKDYTNIYFLKTDEFVKEYNSKVKNVDKNNLSVPKDGHYNDVRNEIIAEIIYKKIKKNKFF